MAGPSFDAKSKLKLVKICFYLRRRPPPGPETPLSLALGCYAGATLGTLAVVSLTVATLVLWYCGPIGTLTVSLTAACKSAPH